MPHGQRIAEHLLAVEAVKLSVDPPYTWTSGLKAPIYCDNRMMYGHPEARNVIVSALVSRIKSLHIPPDVIAGTATAAIGWGALVADRLQLPFVYVRAKTKEHGTKKRIEGHLKPGSHVVVIEDLLSTGGSCMATVEALRDEGKCTVTDLVSIFTYEFAESEDKASEFNVRVHPLTTITTLVDVAKTLGKIDDEDAKLVLDFVRDPQMWSKSR